MESIKKYGDLSDNEYYGLLREIEEDDEQLASEQMESTRLIAEDDEHFNATANIRGAKSEDEDAIIEASYGEDAWRKYGKYFFGKPNMQCEKSPVKKAERKKRLVSDKREICAMAFNQTDVQLASNIGDANITWLISELVITHTRMLDKYMKFINRRLTALLRPLIPAALKRCMILFPEAIRESPGFLYIAGDDFDNASFWAQPQVPCYFEQNTEREIIKRELGKEALICVDKAVASYNAHFMARQEKELRIANRFARNKIKSFYDLLKLNPFWFSTLYEHLHNE